MTLDNGLSFAQEEALRIFIEEFAEAIQAASKAQRSELLFCPRDGACTNQDALEQKLVDIDALRHELRRLQQRKQGLVKK